MVIYYTTVFFLLQATRKTLFTTFRSSTEHSLKIKKQANIHLRRFPGFRENAGDSTLHQNKQPI